MMARYDKMFSGGDLRSIGVSNSVIPEIKNQKDFDELFKYLFHKDRIVVMRTADTVEKVTINDPQYLLKHKKEVLELCKTAADKELKWHIALLIPRLQLDGKEFKNAWETLTNWAKDKANSRIVRVNSIEAIFEMTKQKNNLKEELSLILLKLEKENIPSINARIRIIRKEIASK